MPGKLALAVTRIRTQVTLASVALLMVTSFLGPRWLLYVSGRVSLAGPVRCRPSGTPGPRSASARR
jgi:hypothetical protein